MYKVSGLAICQVPCEKYVLKFLNSYLTLMFAYIYNSFRTFLHGALRLITLTLWQCYHI